MSQIMQELVVLMSRLLATIMKEYATEKTARYFVKTPGFESSVEKVARTLAAIISSKSPNSTIEVEGDRYLVSEYDVPERVLMLAAASRVFLSKSAIDRCDPIFQLGKPVGEMLTPLRVKLFFEGWNREQPEDAKFKLARVALTGMPAVQSDLKYVLNKDGKDIKLAEWNEAGTIDPEVTQILGITLPIDTTVLSSLSVNTEILKEEALGKWFSQIG